MEEQMVNGRRWGKPSIFGNMMSTGEKRNVEILKSNSVNKCENWGSIPKDSVSVKDKGKSTFALGPLTLGEMDQHHDGFDEEMVAYEEASSLITHTDGLKRPCLQSCNMEKVRRKCGFPNGIDVDSDERSGSLSLGLGRENLEMYRVLRSARRDYGISMKLFFQLKRKAGFQGGKGKCVDFGMLWKVVLSPILVIVGSGSLGKKNPNRWNRYLIYSTFTMEEADQIVSLPIPITNQSDKVVWSNENSGIYSVKSGYKCYWIPQIIQPVTEKMRLLLQFGHFGFLETNMSMRKRCKVQKKLLPSLGVLFQVSS
ncbi:hypothetical protein Gotur_000044 [Gossypium turneri]